jgi:hypothetical protein
MTVNTDEPLVLRFGGKLVEQLGAQMYPSATATVAELISNAWDADAENVWVQMPFGDWTNGEIVVTDDGVGMSVNDARSAYLIVGRNRRLTSGQRTPRNRLVHGRKGIGKLAAFGTATILELKTRQPGATELSFRLDYDHIRSKSPTDPYQVEPSEDTAPLADPITGEELEHGTRIRLSQLKLKRRLDPDQFLASMSRRFALDSHEMNVWINGETLSRFNVDLQFRFPPDRLPPESTLDGEWAAETLPDGRDVRWWIGFTPKPIGADSQGISVLVRGKLAQRPFKFEKGGGTTGQLGQEYLVGEVAADWIDDENDYGDTSTDLIQSNRDQLQLEDQELESFLEWGRQRLRWALAARDELRREQQQLDLVQNSGLEQLLEGRPRRERNALNRVAAAVARLPNTGDDDIVRVMEAVITARESETAQEIAQDIALADGQADTIFALVDELSNLNNRSSAAFIEARLDALTQLESLEPAQAIKHAPGLIARSPGLVKLQWEFARTETTELSGAEIVLLDPILAEAHPSAMLVVPEELTDRAEELTRQAANQFPDRELYSVALSSAFAGATSWSELILFSIEQHRAWADLARSRLSESV